VLTASAEIEIPEIDWDESALDVLADLLLDLAERAGDGGADE
jgi:hypothetical protein